MRLSVPIRSFWGKWSGAVAKGAQGTVAVSTGHGAWTDDGGHTVDNVWNAAQDAADGDLVNVGMMGGDGELEGYPRQCP